MPRISVIMIVVLLACPAVVAIFQWHRMRLERSQDQLIRAAAARYAVDPALVKAVVWKESRFDPNAHGRAGELGLMQLREIAAREWADAEGILHFSHPQCLDPTTNTLAGTFYLRKLLRRYENTDNPVPYALADYNAGRSRVVKWVEGAGATNSTLFLEQIGFSATRHYVVQVMKRADRYSNPALSPW